MGERGRLFGGLVLVAFAFAAIGCGDDSSTGAGPAEPTGQDRPYANIKGPTREFIIPGGDNLVQVFGDEASPALREKVSRVVHGWMKARVAEDWETDCRYLAREYRESLVRDAGFVSKGKAKNCPQALAFFGESASGTPGNTLTGPIDSLRVRKTINEDDTEKEAYAQWHGPNKIDWVLPLRREGGAWKVYSASPLYRTK